MDQQLSDTESMLWSLESNPNLASTMGALLVLERAPDPAWVTAVWQKAVAAVPRLRLRVESSALGLRSNHWVLDDDFDLAHHLRFLRLPAKATEQDLADTAVQWINDPFDRSRPLWECLVLSGLPGNRAAIVSKLHHSIADGLGALQMAGEIYCFGEPGTAPGPTDLGQIFAELRAEAAVAAVQPVIVGETDSGKDRRETPDGGGGRRLLGRVGTAASFLADRQRISAAGNDAVQAARTVASQFPTLGGHSGSPLWSARSRNRRLEWLEIPTEQMSAAARRHNVRLNDVFVAGCAEGVLRYHDEFGVLLPEISSTVVVSTRQPDDDPTVNAFTPTSIPLPGHGVSADERVAYIHAEIKLRREALAAHRNLLGSVSGLAAVLPGNLSASLAVDQARRIDIATSNVPGPPVEMFFAGQRVRKFIPIGPVSGTALNVTLLSYTDSCFIGMHLDPAAVKEPKLLKNCLRAGFGDLGIRAKIR